MSIAFAASLVAALAVPETSPRTVTFLAPVGAGQARPMAGQPIRGTGRTSLSRWAWAGPAPTAPTDAPVDAPPPDDGVDDAAPDDVAPDDAPDGDPPTSPDGDATDDDGPDDGDPPDQDEDEDKDKDKDGPDASSSDTDEAGDGALSMDDIFGTTETQTEVEVVSEAPKEGEGKTESKTTAAAASGSKASKFLADLETRVRIVSSAYYDTARVDQRGFGRNENRLEFYFAYTPNEHLQIVGDVEPVFFGVAQAQELDDLATQQMLTPFHLESDAAYVALYDVLPNLDIKVGRQVLVWGTADKFNPTNNINADDLEDRPLFTEPIGNQMVVVDYAPLADKLWFQGVYVPIFYPALLPPSAAAALKDPQAPVPYANDSDLDKLQELQSLIDIQPDLEPEVTSNVKIPRARFTNGQSAIKMGTSLGGVDMTVSYFNGRHDIPTPVLAASGRQEDFMMGGGAGCCFTSDVTLIYPRMQVIGFDFTTQLPFLKNLGLWGEGALFLPQAQRLRIEFPVMVDVTPDDGVTNPVSELDGQTIRSKPFIKATAGFDHTFGKHVYVQAQYLRGFIDEFGVDHIGNYAVGGTDLIFFGRHLIMRLFGVVDFPTGRGDNGSYVIYPELIVVPPWGSVTFELGSFFLLGPEDTKFGQKAAGSSIVFFKVAGAF